MPRHDQIMMWIKNHPTEFEEALHLMKQSFGGKPSDRVRSIDPWRVCTKAWHSGRLQECKRRLLAGENAPPIWVSRYWLTGEAVYVLSDGHHRTMAARFYAKDRIAALIVWECEVDATHLVLSYSDAWDYEDVGRGKRMGEIRSFITRTILMVCGAQPAPWLAQDSVTIPIDTRKGVTP